MYLRKAYLEGYITIKKLDLTFQPGLNIIIGKNGAGKTNLFNFLYHALQLNYEGFINFKTKLTLANGKIIELSANNEIFRKSVEAKQLIYDIDDDVYFELNVDDKTIENVKYRRDIYRSLSKLKLNYVNTFIRHGIPLGSLPIIENPYSFKIKKTEPNADLYKILRNINTPGIIKNLFASILFHLDLVKADIKTSENDLLDCFGLVSSLKDSLLNFSDIKDIRVNENVNFFINAEIGQTIVNNFFLEYKVDNNWIPFSYLSDGTKRIFYIIAEIAFQGVSIFGSTFTLKIGENITPNKIILLEEPELGIHPHQLEKLIEFLKEQARTKQIIISTHSPLLLDMIGKNELDRIQIATLTNKGTQLKKLSPKERKKAKIYIEETGLLSDYWRFSDLEA